MNDLCIYIFGVVCKHLIVLFTGETRFRSTQGKVGNLFVALVLSSERQLQDYSCGEDLKEEDAALLFPGREDKRGAFYVSFAVEIESYRFPKTAPVLLCNPRHIF